MATSSVSSTTSTTSAADLAAANKANAQKIMTSLGAGSGVDVTSLAQSLVNAEGIPQQNAINAKITKNDNKVSGLSAVMFMMSELKTKLSALKDRNSFNTVSATNTNTSALNVTASNMASVGTHQITVNSLSQSHYQYWLCRINHLAKCWQSICRDHRKRQYGGCFSGHAVLVDDLHGCH